MSFPKEISLTSNWIGVVVVLFGLLFIASQGTELLKQAVVSPGSVAETGIPADCRTDELEEEGLSLEECQLMVSNVQSMLASSPDWWRPTQFYLALAGIVLGAMAIVTGIALVGSTPKSWAVKLFAGLLLIDSISFIATINTGPLLRAVYLWPDLLWFFIHLCLLTAMLGIQRQEEEV